MNSGLKSPNQLILIVEDSEEDFEATKRALSKANLKNPIHRFTEGEDALDFMLKKGKHSTAERPGLVLLDLNLPGMDGREVLQEIKGNPSLKSIPVVVLTTSDDKRDIEACYDEGANSYIQKPVNIEGLFEAIARLRDYWFEVVILPK